MLVGPIELIGRFCRYEVWHREGRRATLRDLMNNGTRASDFRFALLMAGHYSRPRQFMCYQAHDSHFFLQDARSTRRRLARLAHQLRPLPAVPTYAAARQLLGTVRPGSTDLTPGLRALNDLNRSLSENLHTPRAVAALYTAIRRIGLADGDRKALLAGSQTLLGLNFADGHTVS